MRILVTGGGGNVGRPAVDRLVQLGHQVRVIGRSAGVIFAGAAAGVEYRQCDVTDYDRLQGQMQDVDGVVHLAGVPHPSLGPGPTIFRVNCAGTFNVYEAAAQAGIKRVVSASSIQALGYTCGVKDVELQYFPIDEEHPGLTTDPYAFSKQVIEEIAAYYWRRDSISGVCLRLPIVCRVTGAGDNMEKKFLAWVREASRELMLLDEAERKKKVERVIAACDLTRAVRGYEVEPEGLKSRLGDDAALAFARLHFWAAIHADDAAQAIEKALTASYEGSHSLFVTDRQNFPGMDAEYLASMFYPNVRGRKKPLEGPASLVSGDEARKLIGFMPEHSLNRELVGG